MLADAIPASVAANIAITAIALGVCVLIALAFATWRLLH